MTIVPRRLETPKTVAERRKCNHPSPFSSELLDTSNYIDRYSRHFINSLTEVAEATANTLELRMIHPNPATFCMN